MTQEDRELAKQEKKEREIFRRVFNTEDGRDVLCWILNSLNYYSNNPQDLDPLLMAFCNRLLAKVGIIHPLNLLKDTESRLNNSNDLDLDSIINSRESE